MAVSDLGLGLICGIGGIAIGWGAHAFVYPVSVSTKQSAEQGQEFVSAAIEAEREIISTQGAADISAERVRTITKTIMVDKGCPPGRGPVSTPVADSMRLEFSQEG